MGEQFLFHRLGAELTELHDAGDSQQLVHLVEGTPSDIGAGAAALCESRPRARWEPVRGSGEELLCGRCLEWTDEHEEGAT